MSKRLNFATIGLTTVAENIRAALFTASDPLAVVQSILELPPHNDRYWVFYGLDEGVNFILKIQRLLAGTWQDIPGYEFTFTTDDSSIYYKEPVQIRADVTTGFVSGVNTVTFDGTAGKDDWRGFDVRISRLGADVMKKGVDFSWDIPNAVWTLLVTGDKFGPGEWYDVEFILQLGSNGGGEIMDGKEFQATKVITNNYSVLATDFGNKMIIQGAVGYLDLTLPDIATIPENKFLWIESGIGSHINAGLKTFSGAQKIDWGKGNLTSVLFGLCESLAIYKQIKADTTQVWRIHEPSEGNWFTAGRDFHSFDDPADVINALQLDGSAISSINYARLYAAVLNFNSSKVCAYADHGTGYNYLKFSLADPSTGLFFLPDTRNLFLRNSSAARDAGLFQDQAIQTHNHPINGSSGVVGILPGANNGISGGGHDGGASKITATDNNVSTDNETRPPNFTMNHFILT